MPDDPNMTPDPNTPPAAPPAEDWKKKAEEAENRLKDQDSKINELQTTIQTINKRFEVTPAGNGQADEDESELKEIMASSSYDPEGSAKRMSQYMKRKGYRIAQDAVSKATGHISTQNVIEKLKAGVKSSNPDFDDDIVDVIMQRAEVIAASGKVKTAEEAVNEAAKFVKSKFEGYAAKAKAVPPLPAGAGAEGGGNPAPSTPPADKVEDASDVIEKSRSAKEKRIL
jgi:hypothetical protein